MDVAQAGTAFDAATVDMQRLRLGTEVSYEHTLSSGASLIPWGEAGLHLAACGKTPRRTETGEAPG